MFGMPAGSALGQIIHELTQDHERTHLGLTGQEPPLLELLRVAVRSDVGGAAGGGGARAKVPFDPTALQLWGKVTSEVYTNWRFYHPKASKADEPTHLVQLQQVCYRVVEQGIDMQAYLLQIAMSWAKDIRDMLEPPQHIPLRGTKCPRCRFSHLEKTDEEGTTTYHTALLVHMGETPPRGECLVCGEDWVGGELMDLRADIVKALEEGEINAVS